MGIFAFQGFVVATLLAIIAGMLIISDHPAAFVVMSICLAANVVVFLLRLFYPPWHYNIYILQLPGSPLRSRSERSSPKLYSGVAASPTTG